MSANPFHRDRKNPNSAISAPERDTNDVNSRFRPLTIETRAARPIHQTKHVQFASPPVPETPLSYSYSSSAASSPESLRYLNRSTASTSTPGQNIAPSEDPLRNEDLDRDSRRIDGATGIGPQSTPAPAVTFGRDKGIEDPTRGTGLSGMLAGMSSSTGEEKMPNAFSAAPQEYGAAKQTMDVDAFTQLLLTGTPSKTTIGEHGAQPINPTLPANVGDSSSNTDSASISRQSIFEPVHPELVETPRSSQDLDPEDARAEGQLVIARPKPPPPAPRHSKSRAKDRPVSIVADKPPENRAAYMTTAPSSPPLQANRAFEVYKSLPPTPGDTFLPTPERESGDDELVRPRAVQRPPNPPLSRRRSHGKESRLQSSQGTSKSPVTNDSSPLSSAKAPPPPPSRRQNRGSMAETLTSETPLSQSTLEDDRSNLMPPPLRTPSTASRTSTSLTTLSGAPPPLPPPRRARVTSRSSVDSQRPTIMLRTDEGEKGSGLEPSYEESQNISGASNASNASDILAHLAALQREVDAFRDKQEARRE